LLRNTLEKLIVFWKLGMTPDLPDATESEEFVTRPADAIDPCP